MTHIYAWGNNPRRAELKGRKCKLLASGKMGSVLIEFENGEKVITSRRALRKYWWELPSGSEIVFDKTE